LTVSVDVVLVGFGLNATVAPCGWPLRLSVTDPPNPFWGAIVTLYVAVPPRGTERLVGDAESTKSGGGLVTVTLAVPSLPPLDAVTVKGPPAVAPAVNSPDWLIEPPPLTDQLNAGCELKGWPNWSLAVALNGCDAPVWTEALAGETVIDVRTGVAVAVAMLPRPVGPSQPAAAVQSRDGVHVPFDPEVTS
jgi:hypothetical protein